MGVRADLVTGMPEPRVRDLVDVLAHVVARLDLLALPEPVADRSEGQQVPTLPVVGS